MKPDPETNLFKIARDQVAREDAALVNGRQLGRTLTHARIIGTGAAENYMRARGIGKSAVDLIPPEIRHPCGPIRTNECMDWTYTPGILKLTAWFVRLAWQIRP